MTKIIPRERAIICNQVVDLYKNLLNSYVSDFYIEDHWNTKLPNSWKQFLSNLPLNQLADLLNYQNPSTTVLAPLTIICIRKILQKYSVQREQVKIETTQLDKNFMKYFWKNVKLKKQHEIEIMSEHCHRLALKTGCFNIIDIGSGLGHLSRLLAFKYGLRVITFEANSALVNEAPKLDYNFENMLAKKSIGHRCNIKPLHVCKRIEETLSAQDFADCVKKLFSNDNDNFKFGIIGLHPCGNLGATLLRLYNETPSASFINIVSCCYNKLTLAPQITCGYPLSELYKNSHFTLDHLSSETACHAIENYIVKIKTGQVNQLKVHAYRAALECLMNKVDDRLRHCKISNVKYEEMLTLKEYCLKATKYNITFCTNNLKYYEELIEDTWANVIKFFSLKILLGPLVETIILCDRLIYLQENGSHCDILPVFDSRISPRNHVLTAQK